MADDGSFKMGEMAAQIAILSETVKELSKKSDERGSRTYQELEQIRMSNAEIKRDIRDLSDTMFEKTNKIEERLSKAEPKLAQIDVWRERGVGAALTFSLLGSVATGGIMLAWKWISTKLGIT